MADVSIGEENFKGIKSLFYNVFGKNAQEAKKIYEDYDLRDKVPHPCHHRKIYDGDNEAIHNQEGLCYNELERRKAIKIDISQDSDFKIPKILHCVWLSRSVDSSSDRELKFPMHNPFFESNIKNTPTWTHYLWTNNLDYIPAQIKQWGEKYGVEVRDIRDLAGSDNHFAQQHHFSELIEKINEFAEQNEFGLATDITRYLAMHLYGGVYIDGDYKIDNLDGLEKIMRSYSSFFGIERYFDSRVGNAFLAAEKENPVIMKVAELVERNIMYPVTAPEYVNYAMSHEQSTLVQTGPIALSVAFNTAAREGQDLLLPYGYIFSFPQPEMYRMPCKHWSHPRLGDGSYSICRNIGVIGEHMFATTWITDRSELDFYC